RFRETAREIGFPGVGGRPIVPRPWDYPRPRGCRWPRHLCRPAGICGISSNGFLALCAPVATQPKGLFAIQRPFGRDTLLSFGEEIVQFRWLEVRERLAILEGSQSRG